VAYSAQDLNNILKLQLEQRRTSFVISYKADTYNLKSLIQTTIGEILKADDYLQSCTKSYGWKSEGYQNDVTINFDFNFYTTRIQEDYVDSEVTAILKEITKVSMNDHQKEKAIHDYIVTRITYDTTLKNYNAYEALKYGLTVCNGYAQLAYKMLKESGIETKIVVGTGNGENHAWNLVKLDNIWYHLDCTWDDPIPDVKGRILYNYFNLSDKEISKDHVFENLDYPVANQVYNNKTSIFDEKEFAQWTKVDSTTKIMPTKEWNINFNKEVDELSLRDKIFICRQGTNSNFPLILELSEDKKSVKIKHNTPFQLGQGYSLYISKDINGANEDINLKNSIRMDFTIVK
jgi:transglutaminase-like putative cysteine protease